MLSARVAGRFEASCCGSVTKEAPRTGPLPSCVGSDPRSPCRRRRAWRGAFSFSGFSATTASVVRNRAPIDAAFCSAERVTFAGSTIAGLDHVDVLAGGRVQAVLAAGLLDERADLLDHDAALEAGVHGDLLQRLLERATDDVRARELVALEVHLAERALGHQERDAAAGDDALFDGRLRRLHRVLDAVLLLLQLDLGGRADLDHRDAAGQLRETLLELLAVVVGVGLLDLGLDLVDPAGDVLVLAAAVDDRRLVLRDVDPARRAQQVGGGVLELEADLLGDDRPPVRIAMSCSIALRRSPNPGALTATLVNVPRILFTTSVASASPSMSSAIDRPAACRPA